MNGEPLRPASGTRHVIEVTSEGEPRLDTFVARALDLSRTQAATLIATGNVLVGDRREKASYRPLAGDRVTVEVPAAARRDVSAESIPLHVVFEDDELLVVDKPAGMVVHPAPGNWTGTLVNALKGRGGDLSSEGPEDRAGIVHRLDKDTSGLLIVAKTDRTHRLLSAALAARRISRRYAALSWGHLDADRITVEKPLARDSRDRTRMAVVSTGRAARTDFVRLARFDSVELLRAHLHSGRTHQIRIHLASIGHPVVGDETYGGGIGRRLAGLSMHRHFLHAAWLRFAHPVTGQAIDLRSPLPPDLAHALATIDGSGTLEGHTDPLDYLGFYRDDS